jgi:arabinose-5-phosphate isomerase
MSDTLLETAKRVILIEAHAVTQLAEQLDQGFIDACGLIQNCTGKVVLIGMGKSGHLRLPYILVKPDMVILA